MFSKKFIAATKEYSTYEHHVPAPMLRKVVGVDKPIEKATITICGLGFYELYLNGKRLTKGLIAPYVSNPNDILYYDCYDVTATLQSGKNAVGIMLGNGHLNAIGGAVWSYDKAPYRSAPKVALALEISYADGTSETFEADDSFKTAPSEILYDDLRCGEIVDARLKADGWTLPDFDDSAWATAIEAITPTGEARLCEAEPIVVRETLAPVSITKNRITRMPEPRSNLPVMPAVEPEEGYLYDFGINTAGNIRLRINGEAGQTITLQFGELLAEDGGLDLRAMHFQPHRLNHRITYTCSGNGVEEYAPTFTYQGFRYCLVKGITPEQATKDLLTYEVMSSDLRKNGDFSCSDDVVNRLQAAAVNADLSNFYYYPTDCPHREKNGWTADAALSSEHMLFNLTPEVSFREWLRNIRAAQNPNGAVPCVVPVWGWEGWGYDWGAGPSWDSVIVIMPYYTWLYRGDEEIVRENAHAIIRYFEYLTRRADEDELVHFGLGDWVPIGRFADNPKTPLEVTDTLMCMNICHKASTMFRAVGLDFQADVADNLFARLRTAARRHLIEADGATVRGRTQTAQILGIRYGLFEPGEKRAAFDLLLELIRENDNKMDVGCLGIREMFHVLADFGHAELAYKLIVGPEHPSYGHWILHEDATALFEQFLTPEDLPNSKNHHFLGDISSWFVKYLAGIKVNPYERNCNEVEISPVFLPQLDHAEGYIGLPCGQVSVHWERNGDAIRLTVSAPEGCRGLIKMPAGYDITEKRFPRIDLEAGEHTYDVFKI